MVLFGRLQRRGGGSCLLIHLSIQDILTYYYYFSWASQTTRTALLLNHHPTINTAQPHPTPPLPCHHYWTYWLAIVVSAEVAAAAIEGPTGELHAVIVRWMIIRFVICNIIIFILVELLWKHLVLFVSNCCDCPPKNDYSLGYWNRGEIIWGDYFCGTCNSSSPIVACSTTWSPCIAISTTQYYFWSHSLFSFRRSREIFVTHHQLPHRTMHFYRDSFFGISHSQLPWLVPVHVNFNQLHFGLLFLCVFSVLITICKRSLWARECSLPLTVDTHTRWICVHVLYIPWGLSDRHDTELWDQDWIGFGQLEIVSDRCYCVESSSLNPQTRRGLDIDHLMLVDRCPRVSAQSKETCSIVGSVENWVIFQQVTRSALQRRQISLRSSMRQRVKLREHWRCNHWRSAVGLRTALLAGSDHSRDSNRLQVDKSPFWVIAGHQRYWSIYGECYGHYEIADHTRRDWT